MTATAQATKPTPSIDPGWVQDTAFAVNTACSNMQRVASQWRDRPKLDPMQVVIRLRETAVALHALADRIEGKRNAVLQLESCGAQP